MEASSLREIPLAEELETVELYMNIENIRFSNEIDFQINISEDIDTHTIKIPSLILQPFLEKMPSGMDFPPKQVRKKYG